MSTPGKSRYANILLLIATSAVCLAAAYAVSAVLSIREPETRLYDRHLIWSSLHFKVDEKKAAHYIENESVREIGVYNGVIEYDIHYKTNNLGLIDDKDYAGDKNDRDASRHYAFVGDSFTAGSGAEPWVPQLRDKLVSRDPSFRIYNLGVAGTGCIQFERLLNSLSDRFQFKKIFILAISDDFSRLPWRPVQTGDELRFCNENESDEKCLAHAPIATILDYNATTEDILRHTDSLNNRAAAGAAPQKPDWLSRRLKTALKRMMNFNALRGIRRDFPDSEIVFIHLPQREEVLRGEYDLNLRNSVKQIGMRYFPALEKCAWTADMFHPHDPHPNEKGYRSLSACIEKNFF